MTDYLHEEAETDRIADAQMPIGDEEIMLMIKRVSREVEAIGADYEPDQHRSDA